MPGPWDVLTTLWDGATLAANATSPAVKLGAGAEVRAQLQVEGAVSGTSPTLDVRLQDSADGTTWADLGVAFAQVTGTGAEQSREFRVREGRPWVRAVATVGGTSPSFGGVALRLAPWSGRATAPLAS
jgi:hypothetical protein